MKLYKVTEVATSIKHYTPDRAGLRAFTKLSEASLSKIMAKVHIGQIAAGRKFVIEYVDIDENSIKEAQ